MSSSYSSQSSLSSSLTSSLGPPEYGFTQVEIYKDSHIGSGAFGVVCKAKADHLNCAAKFLHPTFIGPGSWAVDKFMQECSFLASLHHPHIVQFLGLHSDPSTGQIALLLELMSQNLTNFLHSFSPPSHSPPFHVITDISHDVSLAILYLHGNGIIHRDLSSNNVLLTEGRRGPRAKISDFGMSKLQPQMSPRSSLTQVPGCPVYMPPEAWLSPPVYTQKLDVFSLGVLMLQMITCCEPNPGPLETLIEDERSPTGFLKLPVSEIDRRREDIEIIPLDHPLKGLVLECLNDKAKDRPSSCDMCLKLKTMKSHELYHELDEEKEEKILKERENKQSEVNEDNVINEFEYTKLAEKLSQKETELKETKDKVNSLENQIKLLKKELTEKDDIIREKEAKEKEMKEEKRKDNETSKEKVSNNNYVLSSLSPETLQIIAQDRESRVFNLAYKIKEGSVVFHNYSSSTEELDQTTRIFLQVYQHFFNSGQIQVSFIPVPVTFPQSLIDTLITGLNLQLEGSHYEYIEIPNVFKIVSKTIPIHKTNVKLISDILNLRKDLGEGRTLTLIKGDIVHQDVSIIVSAANCCLQHTWGVSAAINVASQFEVQRHCDEYISKNGGLELGQVCYTKAGGDLKCSWIIHAIGPPGILVKQDGVDFEVVREMKQLTQKILQKGEKLEAKSIAIPAISSGSLSLIASISARGILQGINSHRFSSSSPIMSDVRVVVLKDVIFIEFVKEFIGLYCNKQNSSSKKSTPNKFQRPVLDLTKYSSDQSVNSSCKHQ